MTQPISRRARHRARRFALQALYQWQLTQSTLADIELQFFTNHDMAKVDTDYFQLLIHEVPKKLGMLDAQYASFSSRDIEQISPIERTILRLASYELAEQPAVPYRVVINEAVELAKRFGAQDSHKFINSILDQLAKKIRAHEIQADE